MFDDETEVTLRIYPPTGHFATEPLEKLPALIEGRTDDTAEAMADWQYEETDAGLGITAGNSEVSLYQNIDDKGKRYVAVTGDQGLAQEVQQVIETDPLLFGRE